MDADARAALERPDWAPADVDLTKPNIARVYDFYLDGVHHFEIDREFGERAMLAFPDAKDLAKRNRRFVTTAARVLAREQGIAQFLDLGAGIPGIGSTHEIVRRENPDARVVYVDVEAVAFAHAELIVNSIAGVEAVQADFTRPAELLARPIIRDTIDFTQPVAILMGAVVHLLRDEQQPKQVVEAYRNAVVPGSGLVFSHGTTDGRPDLEVLVEQYKGASAPFVPRSRGALLPLLEGWELLDPGLVMSAAWRSDLLLDAAKVQRSGVYAAVGIKP